MNVICYSRAAADSQRADGSLVNQRASLTSYCSQHGLTVVEHVEDRGVSGRTLERPGIDRILALLQAGAADCVVVADVSRIGRARAVIEEFRNRVGALGAEVQVVDGIDLDRADLAGPVVDAVQAVRPVRQGRGAHR